MFVYNNLCISFTTILFCNYYNLTCLSLGKSKKKNTNIPNFLQFRHLGDLVDLMSLFWICDRLLFHSGTESIHENTRIPQNVIFHHCIEQISCGKRYPGCIVCFWIRSGPEAMTGSQKSKTLFFGDFRFLGIKVSRSNLTDYVCSNVIGLSERSV